MSKETRDFRMNSRVRSSGRVDQAEDTRAPAVNRNVAQIAKLEEEQIWARGLSQRIALAVTRAAGTSTFALAHLVWFASWIAINTGWVRRLRPFDPFPFNLLTTVVSLEAIFLSIWILISQNDMARQSDRRAHLDLQVNLLAEQESTETLRLVKHIADRLGVSTGAAADDTLEVETDLEHLASTMDETLPESAGKTPSPSPPQRT
jgi:uncharacterized membrane protein